LSLTNIYFGPMDAFLLNDNYLAIVGRFNFGCAGTTELEVRAYQRVGGGPVTQLASDHWGGLGSGFFNVTFVFTPPVSYDLYREVDGCPLNFYSGTWALPGTNVYPICMFYFDDTNGGFSAPSTPMKLDRVQIYDS